MQNDESAAANRDRRIKQAIGSGKERARRQKREIRISEINYICDSSGGGRDALNMITRAYWLGYERAARKCGGRHLKPKNGAEA